MLCYAMLILRLKVLVRPGEGLALLQALGERENCPVAAVGTVTGDGIVLVKDSIDNSTPFALPLSLVLGKMPQKSFKFDTVPRVLRPLTLPAGKPYTCIYIHIYVYTFFFE